MLELHQVWRHFGGLQVLQDVQLRVEAGSIQGLIGPNGAGKTTVFNLVTGLLAPNRGDILLDGRSLLGVPPHGITRRGVARTFQNIRLFKDMTLLENVVVGRHRHLGYGTGAWLFGSRAFRRAESEARERAAEMLSWVGLDHKADETAEGLSYGEQRKLELARALATEPRLLLLDEPVAGMNPSEKTALMALVRSIRDRGYTIFIIEHDMRFVMGLCERIAVLNFGRIVAEGPPQAIRSDERVIEAYLGRDDEQDEAPTPEATP